jgi:hypothetical protein
MSVFIQFCSKVSSGLETIGRHISLPRNEVGLSHMGPFRTHVVLTKYLEMLLNGSSVTLTSAVRRAAMYVFLVG